MCFVAAYISKVVNLLYAKNLFTSGRFKIDTFYVQSHVVLSRT